MHEQEMGGNHIVRSFVIGVLNKHYSGDQIKETKLSGACSTYCRKEKYIQEFFVGKPYGMRPLGERNRTWKDSMKMDSKEIGQENVDWIRLLQDSYK
jgi:hypothetical protein